MNPRNFGASIWLLLFGAASVLLIGAFTRFDSGGQPQSTAASMDVPGPAPSTVAAAPGGGVPTLPSDLSAGLAEIIKMAQAHIPEDTILAYIQNSGQIYGPSADEILYLTDLGVSDQVVKALLQKPEAVVADNPAPAAPPAAIPTPATLPAPAMPPVPAALSAPAMPPATESMIDVPPAAPLETPPPLQNPQDSYFYNSLAPYGDWVQTPDGWGWQPMVAAVDPGWTPYCDRGQWMLTDDGWYWQSDYSWGWAAFHYGRWRHGGGSGWVWVPGNVWAPAWVAWRNTTDGFAGWAALPPGVLLEPGVGLVTVSGRGGFKAGYGLNAASFTFVPQTHFLAHNPGQFAVGQSRAGAVFRSSVPVNNYSFSGGRILNLGVSAGQIAAATGTPVPKMALREAASPEAASGKSAGRNLAVFRPNLDAPATREVAAKETQPVLINKTPHPFATDAAISRGASSRPAAPAPEYGVSTPRPTATLRRTGFGSSSFNPAPSPVTPSTAAPALPTTGWQALRNGGDTRRVPSPNSPAPEVGYPAYSQRGIYPPPPVPGSAQFNFPTPRNAAGYSVPSYEGTPRNSSGYSAPPPAPPPHSAPPPAPAENHASGGQSSQGSGATGAGSSSNSSKTGK
jgi:hypothetical protein